MGNLRSAIDKVNEEMENHNISVEEGEKQVDEYRKQIQSMAVDLKEDKNALIEMYKV